uniref:Uncharacterized protein n=1 Tax=Panagrolaimus sp. PS1159 TaxID=55785 RepID=A0AC35F0Q9_9BILA
MMQINFNILPYTCQQRFVEIAETEVIYEFSKLSPFTKNLCKNRKVVNNFEYSPFAKESKDSDSLFVVKNFKELQKLKSIEIIDEFKIEFSGLIEINEEADSEFTYRFEDFKMISRIYKRLDLKNVVFDNISDLIELIGPNVIEFSYVPKFFGWDFKENWENELNELFAALDKVQIVRLLIGFKRDETHEELKKCDEIIEKWRKQRKNVKQMYWHISLNHGPNGSLAKVYRKTGLKTRLQNGRLSFNTNIYVDSFRYANIVQGVHIDKFM